jgi:hypothetical protein
MFPLHQIMRHNAVTVCPCTLVYASRKHCSVSVKFILAPGACPEWHSIPVTSCSASVATMLTANSKTTDWYRISRVQRALKVYGSKFWATYTYGMNRSHDPLVNIATAPLEATLGLVQDASSCCLSFCMLWRRVPCMVTRRGAIYNSNLTNLEMVCFAFDCSSCCSNST